MKTQGIHSTSEPTKKTKKERSYKRLIKKIPILFPMLELVQHKAQNTLILNSVFNESLQAQLHVTFMH